jgi:hypothetical protein
MFNKNTRWDRPLPQSSDDLGQRIDVLCLMESGRITPRSFLWRGRTLSVSKVLFRWKEKIGKEEISFFSVQTPQGAYQIAFRGAAYSWHMQKLLSP